MLIFFPKRVRDLATFFFFVPRELCQLDDGLTERKFQQVQTAGCHRVWGWKGSCSHPFQLPVFNRWRKDEVLEGEVAAPGSPCMTGQSEGQRCCRITPRPP